MQTLAFIIPSHVEFLDLAGPVQVFVEAKFYGFEADIKFYSFNEDPESTAGLGFGKVENFTKANLKEGDFIFVPGMDAEYIRSISFGAEIKFFKWLKECSDKKDKGLFHLQRCLCFGSCRFVKRYRMHHPLEAGKRITKTVSGC